MSKRVSLLALALCAFVWPVRVSAQEPAAAKPKPEKAADAAAARRVAEDRARQERERGYASVQLPPSLRTEVLRLAAKRDRALGEEFLTKLDEARKKEADEAASRVAEAERQARGGGGR